MYIHTRYNNSIPEKALWKQTLLTWSILNLLLPSKYFPCGAIASSLEIFLELVFSYIFPLYVLAFCFRVELKTSRFMIGNNRVKHYIKKSDKMGNWYFFSAHQPWFKARSLRRLFSFLNLVRIDGTFLSMLIHSSLYHSHTECTKYYCSQPRRERRDRFIPFVRALVQIWTRQTNAEFELGSTILPSTSIFLCTSTCVPDARNIHTILTSHVTMSMFEIVQV